MSPLRKRMIHEVPLTLEGFSRTVPDGAAQYLSLTVENAHAHFRRLTRTVMDAMGHRFLPVYRMADGEFAFAVGEKHSLAPRKAGAVVWTKHLLRGAAHSLGLRQAWTPGLRTVWGEKYSQAELAQARQDYPTQIRWIAERGFLAIHFVRTEGRFAEQYIEPLCDWLDASGIDLNPDNYLPFYFVYAMLCGPERGVFFRQRKVLVVTAASPEKKAAIEKGLLAEGVTRVQFVDISASQAMLDKVNLSATMTSVDLVLVGAGIGSSNILRQLESLQTPCIDAGIVIECLANPARRHERMFLLGDDRVEAAQAPLTETSSPLA